MGHFTALEPAGSVPRRSLWEVMLYRREELLGAAQFSQCFLQHLPRAGQRARCCRKVKTDRVCAWSSASSVPAVLMLDPCFTREVRSPGWCVGGGQERSLGRGRGT